jgi:hypothetical protein
MRSGDIPGLTSLSDPAVRALARRELLGGDVQTAELTSSPVVRGLLAGLTDERATGRPYAKWFGLHWRLISLIELGVPAAWEPVRCAGDLLLAYWARPARLRRVPVIDGRARRCASQEGNALAVACRLGLSGDRRAERLAEHLLTWQWSDGGWNCDKRPAAIHSSFHETLPALWGLVEYRYATAEAGCGDAIDAAADLLLRHEVVYSTRTGQPILGSFAEPHYPPYWHYDLLQALLVLHRAGYAGDSRGDRARQLLSSRRRPDGTWRCGRRWWRPPGRDGGGVEAVDWGDVAHQMVTLNALRVTGWPDQPGHG